MIPGDLTIKELVFSKVSEGGPVSAADIVMSTGLERRQVSGALMSLRNEGKVVKVRKERRRDLAVWTVALTYHKLGKAGFARAR